MQELSFLEHRDPERSLLEVALYFGLRIVFGEGGFDTPLLEANNVVVAGLQIVKLKFLDNLDEVGVESLQRVKVILKKVPSTHLRLNTDAILVSLWLMHNP